MKNLIKLKILLIAFILLTGIAQTTDFTPYNLVVLRVGDGSTGLTNAATQTFIQEYTRTGTLVQTFNNPLNMTNSGTATSEGGLLRSVDGKWISWGCYRAQVGTTGVASTTSSTANRVAFLMKYDGTIDTTTKLTDAYSGNNIRSVVYDGGSNIWLGGTGTNPGVRYAAKGATTSTQLSTSVTNIRTVGIYNGQLYCASAAGAFQGVSSVGGGLPTTSGQTITLLPGFPTSSGPSPYGFVMNPTGDVIYVADDRAVANGGGIQKWTLSGGIWSLAYTLNAGLSYGCRDLAVDWWAVGRLGGPEIFAIQAGAQSTDPTSIVRVVDQGATSEFTTLVTSPTNTAFRGIAFTPTVDGSLPVQLASFVGNFVGNKVLLEWSTVSEVNNYGFNVQRLNESTNEFETIGFVAGNGTSLEPQHYSFLDENPGTTYRLEQIDNDGLINYFGPIMLNPNSAPNNATPTVFALYQNYPNPFNPSTKIKYSLPNSGFTTLKVYNLLGTEVATLVNGYVQAGSHEVTFDASELTSGVYFYKLKSGNNIEIKKLTVLK